MEIRFISWDWKGGPDAAELVAVINGFTHGPIYATVVDTGDADPMIALSDEPLNSSQAFAAWLSE